ncbi:MAG: 2-C-methyl-D-erythritol 4-phosphate cytidylyltransferase [Bacteroidaceae bacterium]|nr:2-C-methyl-D-erythritol 4-phosphate cytidylyltransferase [Bacteroidaceae bacterium]
MRNIGIILAGGSGTRLGSAIPKQFLTLAGKTVLEHSVDTFQEHALIDEIVIVCAGEWIGKVGQIAGEKTWNKVKHIIPGGAERYLSSLNAMELYRNEPECNLIFHDAARPLVSARIITDTVHALDKWQAVDVAVPATDTVVRTLQGQRTIAEIPDRSLLYCEQTPQGFRKSVIEEAYRRALQDPDFKSTDDCGTIVRYLPSVPVFLVRGEQANMKLTYTEDIPVLESLHKLQKQTI